jgi:hypothetical protein
MRHLNLSSLAGVVPRYAVTDLYMKGFFLRPAWRRAAPLTRHDLRSTIKRHPPAASCSYLYSCPHAYSGIRGPLYVCIS